jgi:hypothetical protein
VSIDRLEEKAVHFERRLKAPQFGVLGFEKPKHAERTTRAEEARLRKESSVPQVGEQLQQEVRVQLRVPAAIEDSEASPSLSALVG